MCIRDRAKVDIDNRKSQCSIFEFQAVITLSILIDRNLVKPGMTINICNRAANIIHHTKTYLGNVPPAFE